VKCSLLTLSTFVDDELPAERHSEVDAHLVGCPRCSAGAATLREEKDRVSHLARLSVDAVSAHSLLEQIGIVVEPVAPPTETQVTSPPPHVDDLHSEGVRGGASLPWTPTQAHDGPTANQEVTVPAVSPDAQPDLPLDGVRSVPASWNRASTPPPVGDERGAPGAAATALPAATSAARWAPATDEWPAPLPPKTSWEAALPPPLDSVSHGDDAWGTPQLAVAVPAAAPPAPPPPPPQSLLRPQPPTRLASASGPAALWTRVRDAVGVRVALSRGVDAAEDGVQIITGGPGSRGATLTSAPIAPASEAASAPPPAHVATAPARAAEDVELPGTVRRPSRPVDAATAASRSGGDSAVDAPSHRWVRRSRGKPPSPDDESEWNAFAASSFPLDEGAVERTREVPAKPLGRHSRAVSRQNVPFTTQVSRVLARMAAAVRTQGAAATATVRRGAAGVSSAGPNSRLYAVVAGIGLVFVAALLFARSSPHAPAAAARPAPTDAVTQPHHPAAAGPSSGAVAQSAPPAATNVQTFGSGATGFQVLRMRYGVQAAYVRVVFDLGSAGVAAAGSPKVVVSLTGPQTMLVTFTGALPAGSTGVPPPGKVISSVTLLSSANQKTVYQFQLTRAVSTVGFYLASPTRFVLDLH
jgi:anti-sigma factor RsiW